MPIVSLESDKPSGDRPVGKDTTPLEPDKTSASPGFAGDGNRLTSPASGSSTVEIGSKFSALGHALAARGIPTLAVDHISHTCPVATPAVRVDLRDSSGWSIPSSMIDDKSLAFVVIEVPRGTATRPLRRKLRSGLVKKAITKSGRSRKHPAGMPDLDPKLGKRVSDVNSIFGEIVVRGVMRAQ